MSLVTLDQVVSGASNLLVLLLVAHALQPRDFGLFSLIFFVYLLTQGGIIRSLVSVTVMVHPEDADARPRSALGAAVILSTLAGVLCGLAGAGLWLQGSDLGPPIVLLAVLMPLLGIQDTGRYIAIAQRRAGRAIELDALWLVLIIVGFIAIELRDDTTLMWLVAVWAVSGGISGLLVFGQQGIPRGGELTLKWLRERWGFSWRSLVASSSSAAIALVGSALVAVVSGPLAVAAVRAGLLLERPSTTVQSSVATSAANDIARERPNNRELLVHQRRTMIISGAVAVLTLGILLVIPDSVGRLLLGGVWPLVEPLLLVVGLRVCASAAQAGVRAALLGRQRIRPVMVVDIVGTALSIAGLVVGAALGDGLGAMWGAFVGLVITVCLWWAVFLHHLHQYDEHPEDG